MQLPTGHRVVLIIEMTWGKGTSGARGAFEDEWPDVARTIDRMLRGRRLAREEREDIVQETGLRLFTRWSEIDPERSVVPLAATIAMNLLRDEARATARREARPLPFGELSPRGVEDEALARLELSRVASALQKLTPAQRDALLAEVGGPGDARGAAALKMLRMRARRSLRHALERASALAPLSASLRRMVESVAASLTRAGWTDNVSGLPASVLGLAGVATAVTVALGGLALPDVRPRTTVHDRAAAGAERSVVAAVGPGARPHVTGVSAPRAQRRGRARRPSRQPAPVPQQNMDSDGEIATEPSSGSGELIPGSPVHVPIKGLTLQEGARRRALRSLCSTAVPTDSACVDAGERIP